LQTTLLRSLARNWWVLLLRGIAGVLFGLLAFAWPGITLLTLILFYGSFVAVIGVCEILSAIRGGTAAPRWWLALAGIIALLAAGATFLMPGVTALVLLYIIGGWAVMHGVFEVAGAIQLRREIDNEWALILSGIISILFGLCIFVWPRATALSLIWLIGFYAIIGGVLGIFLAFRLRRHAA
jgi:uncharacterized membrane protein HdeD (DUF308 family)